MRSPLRHKFNAKPTEYKGVRYASKLEAKYAAHLDAEKQSGNVVGYLRQVPLHLSGGIRYCMDFLVFFADGTCEGWEVKGYETKEWKLKQKLIEHEYPWLDLKIKK